jgi:hypothetical protein
MSLEDLLSSKNFKHRVVGYDRLAAQIADDSVDPSSLSRHFHGLIKREANVIAAERALEVCVLFVNRLARPQPAEFMATHAVAQLKATRAGTVAQASALLHALADHGAVEPVAEALLAVAAHKQLKLATEALKVLAAVFAKHGIAPVPAGRILKAARTALGHASEPVRHAAVALIAEVSRRAPTTASVVADWELKPALQTQVDAAIAAAKGTASAHTVGAGKRRPSGSLEAAFNGKKVAAAVDEASLVVTDLAALVAGSDEWRSDPAALPKWQHRKAALAVIGDTAELKHKKFFLGPQGSYLLSTLRQLMGKDAAVAVVAEAVRGVGALADAVGSDMAPYSRELLPLLLSLLKEKKPHLVQPMTRALDSLYHPGGASAADCLSAAVVACRDKLPQVRAQTLAWVTRALANPDRPLRTGKGDASMRELVEVMVPLLEDNDAEVRNAAAECLAR